MRTAMFIFALFCLSLLGQAQDTLRSCNTTDQDVLISLVPQGAMDSMRAAGFDPRLYTEVRLIEGGLELQPSDVSSFRKLRVGDVLVLPAGACVNQKRLSAFLKAEHEFVNELVASKAATKPVEVALTQPPAKPIGIQPGEAKVQLTPEPAATTLQPSAPAALDEPKTETATEPVYNGRNQKVIAICITVGFSVLLGIVCAYYAPIPQSITTAINNFMSGRRRRSPEEAEINFRDAMLQGGISISQDAARGKTICILPTIFEIKEPSPRQQKAIAARLARREAAKQALLAPSESS